MQYSKYHQTIHILNSSLASSWKPIGMQKKKNKYKRGLLPPNLFWPKGNHFKYPEPFLILHMLNYFRFEDASNTWTWCIVKIIQSWYFQCQNVLFLLYRKQYKQDFIRFLCKIQVLFEAPLAKWILRWAICTETLITSLVNTNFSESRPSWA